MSKYIIKKSEINAIIFSREKHKEISDFLDGIDHKIITERRMNGDSFLVINIAGDTLRVKEGQYVVRMPNSKICCVDDLLDLGQIQGPEFSSK